MKSKLLLVIFLLAIGGSASAQLVLPICTTQLPCPGFPLGSVQAGVDQNGWRHFKVILTQNVTLFQFVGVPPPAQAVVNVIFTQDAVGGRTVTFASNITNPCTVTAAANSTTLCQFEFDGIAGLFIGVSSGGTPGGSATQIQFNNSGVFGGLSNVAAGSALVSNGVASSPIFQTKAAIDVRDISGIDCTATNDSSATLATLFTALKGYILAAGPSTGCGLKLTATVEPASSGAWALTGLGGAGGFGAGNTILCSMSATPCLWFDRQRDVYFGQLSILVNNASVGLQISQLQNTSGQISTNNHWHDMNIGGVGSGASAILLAPTGDSNSNNELQEFRNLNLTASSNGLGTGFNTNQPMPNCRGLNLHNVSTNGFATGYTLGCGSMTMIGGLQETNTLDFSGNPNNNNLGGGFIAETHSENSKQWIANFGNANPFGFLFNRNEMSTPDLTKYQWDLSLSVAPFISIGNHWNPNANVTKMVLPSQAGGNWISIGDNLPNSTIANLPDLSHTGGQIISLGTATKYGASIAVSGGFNGAGGLDAADYSGLYLLGNDHADGGSNLSFYTSPGLNIAAMFINAGGTRVFLPWRFIVTGVQGGSNPPATLILKTDKDPTTGSAPNDTGALGMDFTGGVANGGILKLPATSAITYATSTNCAAVGTAANPSVASCTAAPAGSVSCATNASGGTCTVNTTVVTANSEIFLSQRADTVTGTRLGVTCNTTKDSNSTSPQIAAVTAGTSFTFQLGTIVTNPECFSYQIVN